MTKDICAPSKYDPKNNTCFTLEQLVEMANAYNRYITKHMLKPGSKSTLNNAKLIDVQSKTKKQLLENLMQRFNQVCKNDQLCLTQQAFMNEIVAEMHDELTNGTFRTMGPADAKEWLSTTDIDGIMKQYEVVYPNFKFLGAVPANCSELSFCALYKLDYDKYLKNGIDTLAIVYNLDRYGQPGSHWVGLYIDIGKGEIYYCDSNGKPPSTDIDRVVKSFINYYKKKSGNNPIYQYNNIAYQKDGSECGIYSCNFIIRKLSGEEFNHIINNPLSFQNINSCRNVYFRNAPSKYKPHDYCDPNI